MHDSQGMNFELVEVLRERPIRAPERTYSSTQTVITQGVLATEIMDLREWGGERLQIRLDK